MEQVRASESVSAPPIHAVQTAFDNWVDLNKRMTQACIDTSIAQFKGMQDAVSGRLAPGPVSGATSPQDVVHSEISLLQRQIDDNLELCRQLADQTRHAVFAFADAMAQLPFRTFGMIETKEAAENKQKPLPQ
jgi:hypothetical protein